EEPRPTGEAGTSPPFPSHLVVRKGLPIPFTFFHKSLPDHDWWIGTFERASLTRIECAPLSLPANHLNSHPANRSVGRIPCCLEGGPVEPARREDGGRRPNVPE